MGNEWKLENAKLASPSRSFEDRPLRFRLVRWAVSVFCRLYFRIEFRGLEQVPREGPLIVAPNHASYFDPFWVSIPFPRQLRYLTWDRVFTVPLLGRMVRALGGFPIKLDSGDRAALRQALRHLRGGGALMVFPEGGRTRTGEGLAFKPGVIRLALDAPAPILPVTIIGGFQAFSALHRVPRPHKVIVVYHPPLQLSPPAADAEVKDYLRRQAEHLQQIVAAASAR
jgi:1-acyl-sn-glycerol-3-phosphate acyltransferase